MTQRRIVQTICDLLKEYGWPVAPEFDAKGAADEDCSLPLKNGPARITFGPTDANGVQAVHVDLTAAVGAGWSIDCTYDPRKGRRPLKFHLNQPPL